MLDTYHNIYIYIYTYLFIYLFIYIHTPGSRNSGASLCPRGVLKNKNMFGSNARISRVLPSELHMAHF